jgi:hypothetical protein
MMGWYGQANSLNINQIKNYNMNFINLDLSLNFILLIKIIIYVHMVNIHH